MASVQAREVSLGQPLNALEQGGSSTCGSTPRLDWKGDPIQVNEYGLEEIWTYDPPVLPEPAAGCKVVRRNGFVIFLCSTFGGCLLVLVASYAAMLPPHDESSDYLIQSLKVLRCTTQWKHLFKYTTIPLVSLVFTWWHVWLGIQMCFYPVNFIGCCKPVLGWQGIVPRRAEIMAARACDIMIGRLLKVEEIIGRVDECSFFRELQPVLVATTTAVLDRLAQSRCPNIWSACPCHVKEEIKTKVLEMAPTMFEPVLEDIKANINNIVDVKQMSIQILIENRGLLVEMFQKIGAKEFVFIQHFAAVLGFILGVFQMLLWMLINEGGPEEECKTKAGSGKFHCWAGFVVLPTSGLVIGYLTNWLAINLIFKPVWPHLFCGGHANFQGVFLKRQKEVSREMTEIICRELVTARKMLEYVVKREEILVMVEDMFKKHVDETIKHSAGSVRPLVNRVAGASTMDNIRDDLVKEIIVELPNHSRQIEEYMDHQFDLVNVLSYRLSRLPPSDFEGMLHPVFQEDEWMVLLLGGILGVVVGALQAWALGA